MITKTYDVLMKEKKKKNISETEMKKNKYDKIIIELYFLLAIG